MPVQAVTNCSPAEMRRIAWSLVMTELQEFRQGHPASEEEAALLTAQITGTLDLALLCSSLIDLSTVLFLRLCDSDLDAAAASAAQVALDLARE